MVHQLGINLKYLRKKKGLSQIELGQIAGITERTIYNYEIGDKYPKPRTLASLANALEVSEDLLEKGNPETDFADLNQPSNYKNIGNISEEDFIKNLKSNYDDKGALEASELMERISMLFASESLSETAKDELFESISQAYFLFKRHARIKKTLRQ